MYSNIMIYIANLQYIFHSFCYNYNNHINNNNNNNNINIIFRLFENNIKYYCNIILFASNIYTPLIYSIGFLI